MPRKCVDFLGVFIWIDFRKTPLTTQVIMQPVYTPDAVPPLPVFSQAATSGGHVYVSGNIGCTKNFKLVEGGIQAETVCQTSARLFSYSFLSACGFGKPPNCFSGSGLRSRAYCQSKHIYVKHGEGISAHEWGIRYGKGSFHIELFVVLIDQFQFFTADKMPARTCVGVAYLPFGAAVEIECIAEIPK